MNSSSQFPAEDLDHILLHTRSLWDELRGTRIFITGGTGFVGRWLLESLARAHDQLQLGVEAVVLTRHPEKFREKNPHLADHPALKLHVGDVRDFEFPAGQFSYVIHGASETSAKLGAENPELMVQTIVGGTRRALALAERAGTKRFLLISSGAVYGTQPPQLTHMPEEYSGRPDPAQGHLTYAQGKIAAELLGSLHAKNHQLGVTIARCFAFVGPGLPLDAHYAVGNFIRDGLAGGTIQVNGDGTPFRSYLYAADLAIWLWTILLRGATARPYNVGSEVSLTIAQVAQAVRDCFDPPPSIHIARKPDPAQLPSRYVPGTGRAKTELGLEQKIDVGNALKKTIIWHQRTAVREQEN